MARRKGLGKGLDALLGGSRPTAAEAVPVAVQPATDSDASAAGAVSPIVAESCPSPVAENDTSQSSSVDGILKHIPIAQCQRGRYQPRGEIDPASLEELAASIRSQGVMQPIVVRPMADPQNGVEYEIIAGERRWRASQLAGLERVPAVIRIVSDEATVAMALIENLQREDLNPMEEALALHRLQQEFELTHQQVGDAVGRSRTAVSNALRLLNLQQAVKTMLEHGDLEMGHARALLSLSGNIQTELAREVVDQGLSVRQTEVLVRKKLEPPESAPVEPDRVPDANVQRLQSDLADKLGVPVTISHRAGGAGKLVLRYNSLDELDGILEHIQ